MLLVFTDLTTRLLMTPLWSAMSALNLCLTD